MTIKGILLVLVVSSILFLTANSFFQVNQHQHEHQDHSHPIEAHIKTRVCADDGEPTMCIVDVASPLDSVLIDEQGHLLAEEITAVLESINFKQELEKLASQKHTNLAIEREQTYQTQLRALSQDLNIVSSDLYCSETICAMMMEYDAQGSNEEFYKAFFSQSKKGNVFVSQGLSQDASHVVERIMFFPGNNSAVIVPNA